MTGRPDWWVRAWTRVHQCPEGHWHARYKRHGPLGCSSSWSINADTRRLATVRLWSWLDVRP